MPATTKLVQPAFTAGQFCEDDVYKFLGNINVPIIGPAKRKLKPVETASIELKPKGVEWNEKKAKLKRDKVDVKQTMLLVTKIM